MGTIMQDVPDDTPVRESYNVVEILLGILRVTAGMGTPEYRDGAARPELVAQSIRQLRRFREGADENKVDVVGQVIHQILESGVTEKCDIMPLLPAPHGNCLWHDACEVRVHDARP
jgi:hypothetical protein